MSTSGIAARLATVRERVEAATRAAGRSPEDVRLVAVSKTQPVEALEAAYAAGQRLFGENYAQSLRDKARTLADHAGIEWHYIGPIQTNKVRYLVGTAALLHAVDREEVAQAVNDRAERTGVAPVRCLLSVNVGGEDSKSGVSPEALPALYRAVAALPRIRVEGLFCLPPPVDDPEAARPYFARLRTLLAQLRDETGDDRLIELSMGMSHDLEVAIAEGATMVRVGTDIFGPRQRNP